MRALCFFLALVVGVPSLSMDVVELEEKPSVGKIIRDQLRQFVEGEDNDKLERVLRWNYNFWDGDIEELLDGVDPGHLPLLQQALTTLNVSSRAIELLLFYGADPNMPLRQDCRVDKIFLARGDTAAHTAVRTGGASELLELLLEYDADFLKKNTYAETAVSIADENKTQARDFFARDFKLRRELETADQKRRDSLRVLRARLQDYHDYDNSKENELFCCGLTTVLMIGAAIFTGSWCWHCS